MSGPSIRFWVWNEGWVKITLRDGDTLHHVQAGLDEEGWWTRGRSWAMEGGVVYLEESIVGRDCDGRTGASWSRVLDGLVPQGNRMSYRVRHDGGRDGSTQWEAPSENLAYPNVRMVPLWREVDSSCYDQFAELAGF